MNREIKFRMWNIHFKKMTYNPPLWSASRGGIDELNTALKRIEQTEKHILMQFTGLQDKNGKDIYEGDIVKHSGIICKVVYGKKGACFSLFDVRLGETDLYVITDLSAQYMEVIGNEFENPELLTPQP
jgi:uncharacterized phage protein (TIGR01671 family)